RAPPNPQVSVDSCGRWNANLSITTKYTKYTKGVPFFRVFRVFRGCPLYVRFTAPNPWLRKVRAGVIVGQAAKTMRPSKKSRLGKPLVTLACAVLVVACDGPGAQAETETITNAADVRALNAHEAAQGRPVRLQAVVIDQSDPRDHALAVAD